MLYYRTILWLFLPIFLFCQCFKSSNQNPSPSLRISFFAEPATIDPRKSSDFTSATLVCMAFEGLMRNLQSGPEMALAEKIDLSEDLLTYTFHLRPSVWSDGKLLTAHDFEVSWKAQIDPANGSACAYLFYPIQNAEKAFRGQTALNEVGIQCLDDATLQVTLEQPTPYFLDLISFPSYFPIPSHAADQFNNWKEGSSKIISNGPFCILDHQINQQISLIKNDLFWAKGRVSLKKIEIAILPNPTVALKLFKNNELDWIGGSLSPLPIDSLQTIFKEYSPNFNPRPATTFCTFNLKNRFLQNKNLRKALSCAINRFSLIEKITQMGETPAQGMIPPALLDPKPLFKGFDPQAAADHLKEALAEMKAAPEDIQLKLLYSPKAPDPNLAQVLQQTWKEVLGLDIALEQRDAQTIKDSLQQRTYEICLSNWIAQFTDPVNILERFTDAKQLKNYPGWEHKDFISLVQQSHFEKDPNRRLELFRQAEEIFAEEMPLTPLYHWSCINLWSDRVKDKPKNPSGAILFEFVSLKE